MFAKLILLSSKARSVSMQYILTLKATTDEDGILAPDPVQGRIKATTDEDGILASDPVQGRIKATTDEDGILAPDPVQGRIKATTGPQNCGCALRLRGGHLQRQNMTLQGSAVPSKLFCLLQ